MIILGFHQGAFGDSTAICGHDAGAALVIDGEIAVAVEEERFVRAKHTARFPGSAISHCLDTAGIELSQIDRFCFPWNQELDRQSQVRAAVEPTALLEPHGVRSMLHQSLFEDFRHHFGFNVPEARRRCLPCTASAGT